MEEFQKYPITIRFLLYGFGREERETYPIYALVILNRKNVQLSMKMFSSIENWDFEKGRYKESKQFCVYANNKLSEERTKILKAYFELTKSIAKPDLKGVVNLYRDRNVERPEMTLLSYYDAYVEEIKQLPEQYSLGAVEHYRKTKKHLILFMTKKGFLNIRLSELNRNFIIGFEHHLLTTPNIQNGHKPMGANTSATYLKKLKAVVNNAIKKEILTRNPFASYQIKRDKTAAREYLNMEEIEAIHKLDLTTIPRLEKARDFFMFSVYTGLRFSDAANLKDKNILTDKDGVKWITIIQIKTRDTLNVPMLQSAVDIYEKYDKERTATGFILPRIPHPNLNLHIKQIVKMAGINKSISHHCARHTYATTITLQQGIDIKTVSKLMGHASVSATEIYSRVSTHRLLDVTHELNEKLSK